MAWLKRNLLLVVGALVALALLGAASVFLFTNLQKDSDVTGQLNGATEEYKRLMSRDPHPGTDKVDNVKAAKIEQERMRKFLADAKKFFVPAPTPAKLDTAGFKNYLENSIFELNRDAERAGVALPSKYSFTFDGQRPKMQFSAGSLEPLAAEIADIKVICRVLFDSKIHSLNGIRRVSVATDDNEGSANFLPKSMDTNALTGAVVVPYEVSFQGFSSEIAEVLNGFARSPHCFVVRYVSIDRADSGSTAAADLENAGAGAAAGMAPGLAARYGLAPGGPPRPGGPPPGSTPGGPGAMSAEMRSRYGLGGAGGPGGRYGRGGGGARPPILPPAVVAPSASAPVTAAPVARGPSIILDEKPLRVTMSLNVIKFLPPATVAVTQPTK